MKKLTVSSFLVGLGISLMVAPIASAQRAIPTPGSQQQQARTVQNTPPVNAAPTRQTVQMPIPDATVEQAKEHINGEYTYMERAAAGGHIQEAWDMMPERSSQLVYDYCPTCTYKVRLREHMVTLVTLPIGEQVAEIHNGDPAGFKVSVRKQVGNKIVTVQPNGFGMDTNMTVIGTSGQLYPFYLRAESDNSIYVPDLVVRIKGNVSPDAGVVLGEPDTPQAAPSAPISISPFPAFDVPEEDGKTQVIADLKDSMVEDEKQGDFVKSAPFDPAKLYGWGKYKLWGEGWSDKMMPETVFRDEHFTYIRFGDNWNNIELPTAYVVIDEIDELVNTRVAGTTFIVESTNDLISLKIGEKYLCIQWTGA